MNIDPKYWGPNTWRFMHYITVAYPDNPDQNIKNNTYNFFYSLKYLLPCEKCRHNYGIHLIKYPLTNDILSSRQSLFNWLVDIHNEVNKSCGKPVLSYEQAKNLYSNYNIEHYTNTENSNNNWSVYYNMIDARIWTIIIIVILIVIFLIILRVKAVWNE